MNTTLNCNFTLPLYDSIIAVIQPEMQAHCTRWGGDYTTWLANAASFRTDISNRCNALTQGLKNCYALTGPYNIVVNVQPTGSGNAKINSITPASYAFNASYFGGMQTILKAKPTTGYVFDHWELLNHTPAPSTLVDSVNVSFTQDDSVTAVFRLISIPPPPITPASTVEALGVPSAFSPNGDSNNDILFVLGSVSDLDFTIYNRWGQQVFQSNDRLKGWDGTFNGQALNAGVFAYRISGTMPNGDKVDKKGNVTLIK
jgi:gliding motility-associated-like protein